MPPHISLVIIDSDRNSRDAFAAVLKPFSDTIRIDGSVAEFGEALRIIQKVNPNVVIIEVNDVQKGVDEVAFITSRFPRTSVIVSSSEKSSEGILKLMRAGAVEYLLRPIDDEELRQAPQKVGRFWFSEAPEEKIQGKVIAVYYPTGGVGTTTVAVNLAAVLAENGTNVALVDLNLYSGDISTFLDVNPTYTLSSVTSNIARLDANFLMSVMTRHSSGPYILTEPSEVDESISVTPEQVSRVLEFLKGIFSYVVVDCGGQLAGCTMSIFDHADQILFTTVLSLPAIKNAKRYLHALERRGFYKDRVKLVVNRHLPKADIQIRDAEKVLGYPVFQSIPNEYSEIITSINKGTPIVKLLPRSNVSKAIVNLAGLLKQQG